MGTFRETLAEGNEGALHLGPERPRVYSDLSPEDKERYNADIRATNILLQWLPKDIYSYINHYTDSKDIWDNNRGQGNNARGTGAAGYGSSKTELWNANPGQARQMLLMQAQENGMTLDEEQLLFIADPVYDEAGPSYDSDILSKVHDHDHYQDAICKHHEEHEMHDDVQPTYVVDLHANYTSDSNMILYDHNIKKENLKKELHSVKLQLASTINHNKSMVEEVTSLKKDFKQKKKYLEEFLDMKALKEKVAISYKNPLCLTRAKQVQPALYNGYEIVKNNHVSVIVHNIEDTLEIAKITRRKMHDKMKDPECVTYKVKIAPPDYSKENYLATFTPQQQLTTEQIFWSQDIKEQTSASRPTKALTVYPPNTPATLVPR
ncbi:hypothetical protein Tco_1021545, partial [Tanacetum coccineum]